MIKLFDIKIKQPEDFLIKDTRKGDLLISLTGDGRFSGEHMQGKVLPFGMCTTYTPSEGVNLIHAPILLETEDGAKLFMQLEAYLHLTKELEEQMLAGVPVPPEQYYYRGTAEFDTGHSRYKWLENKLFVCEGIIHDWHALEFSIYEV